MEEEKQFNPREHLMTLKGQEYLEVKWRLVWLRDTQPTAKIMTTMVHVTDSHAIFKAKVVLENGAEASGHGSESRADFMDFIEKAETKAIGRALAALGFGTQFTEDFDTPVTEDGRVRIVDAPVAPRPAVTDYAPPPPHGRPQQQERQRPVMTNPEAPATDKQKAWVKNLLREKFPLEGDDQSIDWKTASFWMEDRFNQTIVLEEMTKGQASQLIDALKSS